jgi:hypothetical protein
MRPPPLEGISAEGVFEEKQQPIVISCKLLCWVCGKGDNKVLGSLAVLEVRKTDSEVQILVKYIPSCILSFTFPTHLSFTISIQAQRNFHHCS